eukprot:TRINITY_DN22346_c0_g1_i1.p1 TRINITY_DN22346_c0_g1~~TRINITY_DN22346_c0_g1_i1.p1  ORF type:complete len:312 (-),score=5.71 TRINITY_DN22346_c0_g1_i1:65-1000(-)
MLARRWSISSCFVGMVSAQYLVIPQARPHEPDVLSVCACDFDDNFWLHLLSGLSDYAPRGFRAHAHDHELHNWLAKVSCDPWPLDDIDQAVGRAVGGLYWDDMRFGKRYHYLDANIRDEHYINPRIGLATRAACLPGRALLHLVCAHQALLPAVHGQSPSWGGVARHLNSAREMLTAAIGRERSCDLGSLEDPSDGRGCASFWPWAPVFAGPRLKRLQTYLDGLLGGAFSPDPAKVAYDQPFLVTPALHGSMNPYLQTCVPLVRDCWSWGVRAKLPEQEQCEHCCNPALPGGDPSCFDATYTFERCCRRLR